MDQHCIRKDKLRWHRSSLGLYQISPRDSDDPHYSGNDGLLCWKLPPTVRHLGHVTHADSPQAPRTHDIQVDQLPVEM